MINSIIIKLKSSRELDSCTVIVCNFTKHLRVKNILNSIN